MRALWRADEFWYTTGPPGQGQNAPTPVSSPLNTYSVRAIQTAATTTAAMIKRRDSVSHGRGFFSCRKKPCIDPSLSYAAVRFPSRRRRTCQHGMMHGKRTSRPGTGKKSLVGSGSLATVHTGAWLVARRKAAPAQGGAVIRIAAVIPPCCPKTHPCPRVLLRPQSWYSLRPLARGYDLPP